MWCRARASRIEMRNTACRHGLCANVKKPRTKPGSFRVCLTYPGVYRVIYGDVPGTGNVDTPLKYESVPRVGARRNRLVTLFTCCPPRAVTRAVPRTKCGRVAMAPRVGWEGINVWGNQADRCPRWRTNSQRVSARPHPRPTND